MKRVNTRRLFIVDCREPMSEGWTAFFIVVFLLVLSLAGCESEQQSCAKACGQRGYSYRPVGGGFVTQAPAQCICGSSSDGGAK